MGCSFLLQRQTLLEPIVLPPSRGVPEISHLCVYGALERWAAGASLDVRRQASVANERGQDAQHRRHHQVAGGECRAIEIGLVSERFCQRVKATASEVLC